VTDHPHALGIDIGGTKIAAAVVAPDGGIVGLSQVQTPAADGPDAVVNAALGVARDALAQCVEQVLVCGVGTAGTVSSTGTITQATSALPGWIGTDLQAAFHPALGIPVVVLNDVHAMAIGESRYGAAAGFTDALVVAVGTGIGGGIVHRGRLVVGASGSAGSIGHIPVPSPARRRCPCGGWNHLEAHAAGPAIEASYAETTGWSIRLPAIATSARAGDPIACSVINEAATVLGRALGGAVNLLDPDVLVIGGGVAALQDLITEPLRRGLDEEALPGPDRIKLRFSKLGGITAAIVGAATVAREQAAREHERR